ncbi:hypothetical protein Hanom_Chr11g01050581 [Helianthus anomalus]
MLSKAPSSTRLGPQVRRGVSKHLTAMQALRRDPSQILKILVKIANSDELVRKILKWFRTSLAKHV